MQLVCYIWVFFFSAQLRGENRNKEGASWIRIIAMLCEVQEAEKMTQEDEVSSKVQECDYVTRSTYAAQSPLSHRKFGSMDAKLCHRMWGVRWNAHEVNCLLI